MPDEAKIAKAREIGLRVSKCCGNCTHMEPVVGGIGGVCGLHTYMHQKHEARKYMPGFRFFVCDHHELDMDQMVIEAGWYADEAWRKK